MYLQQAKIRKGSMGLASHSLMREIVAPNTEMVNDGTSLILLALPVVLFVCVCALAQWLHFQSCIKGSWIPS